MVVGWSKESLCLLITKYNVEVHQTAKNDFYNLLLDRLHGGVEIHILSPFNMAQL